MPLLRYVQIGLRFVAAAESLIFVVQSKNDGVCFHSGADRRSRLTISKYNNTKVDITQSRACFQWIYFVSRGKIAFCGGAKLTHLSECYLALASSVAGVIRNGCYDVLPVNVQPTCLLTLALRTGSIQSIESTYRESLRCDKSAGVDNENSMIRGWSSASDVGGVISTHLLKLGAVKRSFDAGHGRCVKCVNCSMPNCEFHAMHLLKTKYSWETITMKQVQH